MRGTGASLRTQVAFTCEHASPELALVEDDGLVRWVPQSAEEERFQMARSSSLRGGHHHQPHHHHHHRACCITVTGRRSDLCSLWQHVWRR